MVTTQSIIDDLGIDWTHFEGSERELVEQAIKNGHYEHLASIIVEVSPEKANEIEKIQKQLRPRAFTFTSQVQKEFEIWLSQNQNEITPEIEKEWSEKMEAEKEGYLRGLGQTNEMEVKNTDGGASIDISMSNKLTDIPGLKETSLNKLRNAGISSADEFYKLDDLSKRRILGPIVAFRFKTPALVS